MPEATRKGDTGSGHGCYPSSPSIEGSQDVFINGKPAVRVGDAFATHGCAVCAPHGRAAAAGSATVFINGQAAVRIGDAIDCGGSAAEGSGNVFIGDLSWGGQASLPVKATLRLSLNNAAGSPGQRRSYPGEPYKLYQDGVLMQQGMTDEEGMIEYEYEPPWTSALKVEIPFGEYDFIPEGFPPVETAPGREKRLDTLGYYDTHNHDETPLETADKSAGEQCLGESARRELLDMDAAVSQAIKLQIP